MSNRYNTGQRLVTPSQGNAYAITPAQAQPPVIIVDQAFQPQSTIQETTGPVERSKGLLIRLIPATLIAGGVSWAVSGTLALNSPVAFLIFFGIMFVWYHAMDKNERDDSAVGLEKYRLDVAERLASQKMEYDAQLRREITAAYLKQLEGPKP